MNETIRIAEQMLTEADGLMHRAKKIIEREEEQAAKELADYLEAEKKRKHRDEMDAFDALRYALQSEILSVNPAPIYTGNMFCGLVNGGYIKANFPAPKVPNPEQKTVEVKRHAKVGETIKIVKPKYSYSCTASDYVVGDEFELLDCKSKNGVKISSKRGKLQFVFDTEYVVVIPEPIKPEVGMWVRRKRDGKMLCVISSHVAGETGIYVAERCGCEGEPCRNTSKFTQKWRCLMEYEYTIVPNYAPTPADMLEVIQ